MEPPEGRVASSVLKLGLEAGAAAEDQEDEGLVEVVVVDLEAAGVEDTNY